MDKFTLAEKLYELGYSHDQVRRVWAYAYNEQHVGRSGRKWKPWEAKALEELSITYRDVEFFDNDDFSEFNNYF